MTEIEYVALCPLMGQLAIAAGAVTPKVDEAYAPIALVSAAIMALEHLMGADILVVNMPKGDF